MKERLLVVVAYSKRAILLPANSGLHCGRSERPLRVQAGHQRGAPAGEDTEGHRLPQGADPAGGRLAGRRRRRGGRRGTDGIAGSGQAGCRAALAAALAALAQRIPGIADLARKEALAKQAREANVNIKVGNLTYAATGIESLRRALDALVTAANSDSVAEQPNQSAPPPPPEPQEAKPDAAALTAALAVLAQRVAGITDPVRKEALTKGAR